MDLQLVGLSKAFQDVPAVREVSLHVLDGELFSLLGPSGCGKTTILRLIAGILAPDAGDVRLGGRSIVSTPMHARNTAMVFQNYALFPHMTVFDNIAFGLQMRKETPARIRAQVAEALELVRLPGIEHRYPAELSGGQQQRVALARALILGPAVLLLDEPLSNLDAKLRDSLRIEIREIQRQVGITAVFVTHDIHEAFSLSDRLAVLNGGRVEQVGTPEDIYSRPATPFVAGFVGQSNHFRGEVDALENGLAAVRTDEGPRLLVPGPDRRVGERVCVMVRPERIRLGRQGTGLRNTFAGRIRRAIYLGGLTHFTVWLSGHELLVQQQNLGPVAFKPDEPVVVEWSAEDCVNLPEG